MIIIKGGRTYFPVAKNIIIEHSVVDIKISLSCYFFMLYILRFHYTNKPKKRAVFTTTPHFLLLVMVVSPSGISPSLYRHAGRGLPTHHRDVGSFSTIQSSRIPLEKE